MKRTLTAILATVAAGACAPESENVCMPAVEIEKRLDGLLGGADGGPAPAAVIAVSKNGAPLIVAAAGCAQFGSAGDCRIAMAPDTKMRVASISKMAVAFTALAVAKDGEISLDADVSDNLGYSFRNPAHPSSEVTLRHLLSHTAGLRDPEAYWVAAPGRFMPLMSDPALFDEDHGPPGAYFQYANINYGVAAAALEQATGVRFDELFAERVATPLGLDVGFNWSGVSREKRRRAATLYRWIDDAWTPQTDGADILSSDAAYFLASDDLDRAAYLETYVPGDNPTLFSPQGGLRASVLDLLELTDQTRPQGRFADVAAVVWRHVENEENGDSDNGLFAAYGLGVHSISGGITRGHEFLGHAGEAYGLLSGAWVIRNTPFTIAYAVTGGPPAPEPGARSGLYRIEESLIDLAFDAVASCNEHL